jgi:eukaryotic-like serine/threonine-protein kinase
MAESLPPSPVSKGDLIAGKYRVGGVIASGGMGVVVEGRHEALDQRVAIKFLRPQTAKSAEAKERFMREARAAARIESEHVVRVFDVGMHEGKIPYMVMELLEGMDLDREMHLRGPLPVVEAVDRIVQALEAVAEAHAMGIVHRDLKPSNLYLASRAGKTKKRVKVLDFGISKVAAEALLSASLTSTKSVLGSPGYMSPEQVRNTKSVDARGDVWSIGVILYELLSGRSAYSGESLGDVFAKIREEPLVSIRTYRPDVPPALDAVIAKCLERDRDKRFPNAGVLREALLPFASESGARGALDSITEAEPDAFARAAMDQATLDVPKDLPPSGNTISATSSQADVANDAETPKLSQRRVVIGLAAVAAVLLVAAAVGLRSSPSVSQTSAVVSPPTTSARSPAESGPPAPLGETMEEPAAALAPASSPTPSASDGPPKGPRSPAAGKVARPPSTRPATSVNTPPPRSSAPPPSKKANDLGI